MAARETFHCEALASDMTPRTCLQNKTAGNILPCPDCSPGVCRKCGEWAPLNKAHRCEHCRGTQPIPRGVPAYPPEAVRAVCCPCCGRPAGA